MRPRVTSTPSVTPSVAWLSPCVSQTLPPSPHALTFPLPSLPPLYSSLRRSLFSSRVKPNLNPDFTIFITIHTFSFHHWNYYKRECQLVCQWWCMSNKPVHLTCRLTTSYGQSVDAYFKWPRSKAAWKPVIKRCYPVYLPSRTPRCPLCVFYTLETRMCAAGNSSTLFHRSYAQTGTTEKSARASSLALLLHLIAPCQKVEAQPLSERWSSKHPKALDCSVQSGLVSDVFCQFSAILFHLKESKDGQWRPLFVTLCQILWWIFSAWRFSLFLLCLQRCTERLGGASPHQSCSPAAGWQNSACW